MYARDWLTLQLSAPYTRYVKTNILEPREPFLINSLTYIWSVETKAKDLPLDIISEKDIPKCII